VELYFSGEVPPDSGGSYALWGADCFAHLAQVIAGLKSAMLGETDVVRQVRGAYREAAAQFSLRRELHSLFQKGFRVAKEVRASFPFIPSTLEGGVMSLIDRSLGEAPSKVLFVGNSEVSRRIIRLFSRRGTRGMRLATRFPAQAEPFGLDHGVSVGSAIGAWWESDLVICATTQGEVLLRNPPGGVHVCTRLLLDLSVPRVTDVEIRGVPLLDLQDVYGVLQTWDEGQRERLLAHAKSLIEKKTEIYLPRIERAVFF
jgi:glutamyl-tRNA reductase